MVEVNEVYKGLHISLVLQDRPFVDFGNFNRVHCNLILRNDQSEVFNLLPVELALLRTEE